MMNIPKDTKARFWSKVDKSNECWLWTAGKCREGYGRFCYTGKKVSAHRFAYELIVGPIPPRMELDHLCNNRNCVNPSHMRIATHAENTKNKRFDVRNTSGFKGVSWHAACRKWVAQIGTDGRHVCLGYFTTPELAYAAYCEAATKCHGAFANFGKAVEAA